jgi:hypothetical protein
MKGTHPLAGMWPPGRLELAEWRELLEALAVDAEKQIGLPGDLQAGCALALRWFGLAWPCLGPETIAASCRASLQLGEPPGVVVALPLADQLQEIAERLDSVYEAAHADPSALAVEVRPPVLLAAPGLLPDPPPPTCRQQGRPPKPKAEPEPESVDDAPELPPGWAEPEPATEALQEVIEGPPQLLPSWATEALQDADQLEQPKAEAQPIEAQGLPVMPAGWCDSVELAAAAGISISGVSRAKQQGRLLEGIHWRPAPKGLRLPGARSKPLRVIWQRNASLEVLGLADPAQQLSADQLRAQVRDSIRIQGARRRQRRKLAEVAADAIAELQQQSSPAAWID